MSTPSHAIAAQVREAFTLHMQGQLDAAEPKYRAALEQAPRNFIALHMLGVLHLQRGQNAEAERFIGKALKIEPKDATALSNRGLALRALQRFDEALLCFNKSAAFNPVAAETHYNRALTLHDLGRYDEALTAFDRAIILKPDYAEAHAGRANALASLSRLDEAVAGFDAALALHPADTHTLHNRGHALMRLGRYNEACDDFARAVERQPDFAEAHTGIGECLLVQGNFAIGWKAYEWRWAARSLATAQRDFPAPRWHGDEDITGKTLLLHAEQGFGDTIQFCRYASVAVARGAHVVLEVPAELRALLATIGPSIRVVARGSTLPAFDYHAPLLSLPLAFGTDLDSIPAAIPYVSADPQRVAEWKSRLSGDAALHVGLVWSGRASHLNDRNRSIPLNDLATVLKIEDIAFIGLQPEVRPADQKILTAIPS
ncbi:MAG: tetratricopeptide repeat protein, partial [Rhodospirillaceae bacterium]